MFLPFCHGNLPAKESRALLREQAVRLDVPRCRAPAWESWKTATNVLCREYLSRGAIISLGATVRIWVGDTRDDLADAKGLIQFVRKIQANMLTAAEEEPSRATIVLNGVVNRGIGVSYS